MTTVLLARHGETAWNRERRAQGWAPIPLNERGREQATALADYLTERYAIDRIRASDLDRAAETAQIVADGGFPHLKPELEPYWRERGLGVYQGLTYEELSERFPAFALVGPRTPEPDARPDKGESLLDVKERVLNGWSDVTAGDDNRTTVIVAHGGPIKLLLGHLKGLDPAESIDRLAKDNCALTEIEVVDGTAEIVRENVSDFY